MDTDTWSSALAPTLTVLEAAELLGIGRTLAYELVRKDAWPTPVIRAGRSIRIPSVPLVALLSMGSAVAGREAL